MTTDEVDAWLLESLEDGRLSRPERQALARIVALFPSKADRDLVRSRAFELARSKAGEAGIFNWLEAVVQAVRDDGPSAAVLDRAEAHFSPGDDCLRAIVGLLQRAKVSVDVCVFTITDDRIADAILAAHRRKVLVRIITDNSKAEDLGSDVPRFESAGIPLRVDRSPYHMHHKYAVFDGSTLLTGSYNWTRGAAADNEENLVVVDDPRLVEPFRSAFDRLWGQLG